MFLWFLSTAAAQTLYPGEALDEAVLVHITAGGFQHLGDLVEAALPREIPATGIAGDYACSEDEALSYVLEDTALLFTVQAVELTPGQERLDLDITLTLVVAKVPHHGWVWLKKPTLNVPTKEGPAEPPPGK